MTPTKEQQAQEYAEKKFPEFLDAIHNEPWPKIKDMLAQVHIDGHTACEQSLWRSVEEELPPTDDEVLVYVPYPPVSIGRREVAYCDGEDWYTFDGEYISPTHFMYIPSLPDTNTEKK